MNVKAYERAQKMSRIQERVKNFKKTDSYKNYNSEVPKEKRAKTPITSWNLNEQKIEDWIIEINVWNETIQENLKQLFMAAEEGNFEIYVKISQEIRNKNPRNNNNGLTTLHIAAQNGHLNICQFITERITLNHKYVYNNYQEKINGNTPLHLAAESGHLDVCQYLIKVQEENPKNYNGETPFQLAKKNRHSKVCRMIIDWNSLAKTNTFSNLQGSNWVQPNQLFMTIKGGCLDDYIQKLKNKSEKNPTMDKYGNTALHMAAAHGQLEIVDFILKHIDEKNPENKVGVCPFDLAEQNEHEEICNMIVSKINAFAGNEDERKLFAGGLPRDAKEAQIKEHFGQFGEIETVLLKTDMAGRSRGFCFIDYKSVDSLEAAVAAEHTISNKKVEVKKAKAKHGKVYIGKLPAEVSDDEIRNHMATFGTIANIEQPFDKIKNERKNFCFITYERENIAKQLLKEGKVCISGHELEVKKVTLKPQYPGGMDPNMGYMMGGHGGYQGGGGHGGQQGGPEGQWRGGYGGDASGYGGNDGYPAGGTLKHTYFPL